jgi:hypothetical protein
MTGIGEPRAQRQPPATCAIGRERMPADGNGWQRILRGATVSDTILIDFEVDRV